MSDKSAPKSASSLNSVSLSRFAFFRALLTAGSSTTSVFQIFAKEIDLALK